MKQKYMTLTGLPLELLGTVQGTLYRNSVSPSSRLQASSRAPCAPSACIYRTEVGLKENRKLIIAIPENNILSEVPSPPPQEQKFGTHLILRQVTLFFLSVHIP